MILGIRAFLVALLLVGSTGSARCQALCAQISDSEATALARSAETTAPEHAGCHGGGVASPEPLSPLSGGSADPCQDGCCTVLTRATVAPISSAGPTSAASSMLAGVALAQVRSRPDRFRHAPTTAPLPSPFHFRNPPLLI
jgi:hypothetical protein